MDVSASERVSILLVDDQPAKLLTYETILKDVGEKLIKARTAREALEHLLKEEIAVILMDVSMPEIDGFELARMIRQHPRCQRTAIIFVSAVHLSEMDLLRGYQTGGVDYVPVPVVPEVLRAKVAVFMDLYRKTRQLERLNVDLEERVARRTQELEASTALLRESDRRKDEFLAVLAHELRNPLAPIRNALALLKARGLLGAEAVWSRDVIERQVDQLTRLVDDLLDVSRVSSGKIKLQPETLDLVAMVRAGIETSRPVIEARKHALVLRAPESPVWVSGDPVRLTQVISNVLNNAAKFQDEGGKITVTVAQEGKDASVRIADRGIGIPRHTLPRVFDLFSQAEKPIDRAHGGLGIGLSLVKTLVELHRGTVTAESAGLGQGSEFTIRLPSALQDDRADRSGKPLSGRAHAGGQSVLVVDDNRDAATSLARLLDLDGYRTEVAHDGHEALRMAEAKPPEIVLLDLGMPELNGFDVCRALRARGHREAFIVAVTGYAQEEDRRRSREAGFDAHLVKPVHPDVLARLLVERSTTLQGGRRAG
jgi:signal transduction histidine kinase